MQETYAAILREEPEFPGQVDAVARDLLRQLLVKEPSLRLGQGGCKEVMRHRYFRSINWEEIRSLSACPPSFINNIS